MAKPIVAFRNFAKSAFKRNSMPKNCHILFIRMQNGTTQREVINTLKVWKKSKYLGSTLTNQNSIHKEITRKRKLDLRNAYYNSVHKLLFL
jgi:hypothetical protein